MIRLHTFPLFSIRPFYLTIRAFKKALHDVIMSRKAIYAMNTLFADATAEELSRGDNVCIVCREDMQAGAKKLPCGHIFHSACLRSWFQRQQTCCTCRSDILNMTDGLAPTRPRVPQGVPPEGVAQRVPQDQGQPPLPPAAAQQQQAQQPHPMHMPNLQAMFPLIPPGFMPHAAAAAPHPHGHPQPQQPPPATTTTPSGVPTTTGTTSSTAEGPGPGSSRPMAPGFAGFPLLGGVPPFILPFPPAPSFGGLSDEEVRTMEGRERGAVEARIGCLRNIQTLLDAATVQLQQYTSILTALA